MPQHRRRSVVHVLLVDDNDMLADMLRSLLDDEPDVVVLRVAHSLADALGALSIAIPDVILLDEFLPEGPASETAAIVHEAAPSAELILWAATDGTTEAGPFLAAALTKGATYDEVLATIRRVGRLDPRTARTSTQTSEDVSRPTASPF